MQSELDTLSEESYKDSTLIMQLLRDNLVGQKTTPHCVHIADVFRLSGLPPRPSPLPMHLLLSLPPRHPRLRHLLRLRHKLYQNQHEVKSMDFVVHFGQGNDV